MNTQDRNQILRAALHLLYNAYRPGCVPISPTSYEAPEQVQWAMNSVAALHGMGELESNAEELKLAVLFWKFCYAQMQRNKREGGAHAETVEQTWRELGVSQLVSKWDHERFASLQALATELPA